MQHSEKIRRMTVFLVLFGIAMSGVIVVILSHNAFAQDLTDLHQNTLYEAVKQTSGSDGSSNSQIKVSEYPGKIATGILSDAVYVSHQFGPDTISVISKENDTVIKEISIGSQPKDIALGFDALFVLDNEYNLTIINIQNNTVYKKIPIEGYPEAIDAYGDTIYLSFSSSVGSIDLFGDYEVIKNITKDSLDEMPIPTEASVKDIVFDEYLGVAGGLFVASSNNNTNGTIFVISEANFTNPVSPDTVIGEIPINGTIKDIAADGGVLGVLTDSGVFVITQNNTVIPIDGIPEAIAADRYNKKIYVTHLVSPKSISDDYEPVYTASLAIIENGTVKEEIPVGEGFGGRPFDYTDISVDGENNRVYISNRLSNSLYLIDGMADKLVAGVTFQVDPFNSGYIVCEDLSTPSQDDLTPPSPIGQYIYLYSGTQCTAKANEGFEFSSWEENLGNNSTQPINVSRSASTWDSFVLAVTDFFGDKPDKPEAILNITKFGTFTANFREAPPPVPPEFWAQMYAVIATVITALFIPTIVGWFKSKRDAKKKLNYFHKQIDVHKQIAVLNQDGKLDGKGIEGMDDLRNSIENAYSEGKLNEEHHESLTGEISGLYEEIFRKKIAAIDNSSNSFVKKPIQGQLTQVRNEIEYAFSKGKINEKHFNLLNKAISKLDGKEKDTS